MSYFICLACAFFPPHFLTRCPPSLPCSLVGLAMSEPPCLCLFPVFFGLVTVCGCRCCAPAQGLRRACLCLCLCQMKAISASSSCWSSTPTACCTTGSRSAPASRRAAFSRPSLSSCSRSSPTATAATVHKSGARDNSGGTGEQRRSQKWRKGQQRRHRRNKGCAKSPAHALADSSGRAAHEGVRVGIDAAVVFGASQLGKQAKQHDKKSPATSTSQEWRSC